MADTDTLDELRRPTFGDEQGDQTARFLAKEYPTAEDAQAAGVDPGYYTEQTGIHPVAQPAVAAPAASPVSPVPTWDSVASHPEFQKLSPEARQNVVDQYAQKAREFALTLPGADATALDDHFSN